MLNKRIIMLAALIVSLLAISTVGAADNATDDVMGIPTGDAGADETIGAVGADDENILSADEQFHGFDELAGIINATPEGGELMLDYNYEYVSGSTDGISIDRPMTIDGNSKIIDGKRMSKIFTVNADNVVLKNFVFMNGKSDGVGGAISWLGNNGTIIYCTFESNNASDYGGAVYWNGKDGNVIRTVFSDNEASQIGGALYWSGDNGTVYSSTFEDNHAQSAGAFFCDGSNVTVIDSTFMMNNASVGGSAIQWRGPDGTVTDSRFKNNNAPNNGGTVLWMSEGGTIANSNFTENLAYAGGALLLVYRGNMVVKSCNFTSNTASQYGGAISSVYDLSDFDGDAINGETVNITDSIFTNNDAVYGGAICWNGIDSVISGSGFSNNSASDDGGAIYWSGPNGTVTGSSFTDNNAFKGGSIFWSGADGTVDDSSFDNSTSLFGGAIYWKGTNGTVIESAFTDNNVSNCGGSICWNGTHGTICDSSFTNNGAGLGGAIYMDSENSDSSTVNCCSFTSNHATEFGGAIGWNSNDGTLNGSTFTNNTAKFYSGAVFWNDDYGGGIYNSIFKANRAENLRNIHSYSPLAFENLTLETVVNFTQIADRPFNTSAQINFTFDDGCDIGGYGVKLFNGTEEISAWDYNVTYAYSYVWNNLAVGNYSLTVAETNDRGNVYLTEYNPMEFEVHKADSKIDIHPIDFYDYLETVIVNFDVVNRTNVTYKVKNDSGETVVNGTADDSNTIEIPNLDSDYYVITIANCENTNISGCEKSASFFVFPAGISLYIDADDVVYPNVVNAIINASVAGDYVIFIFGEYTGLHVAVNESEVGMNKSVSLDRVLDAGEQMIYAESNIPNYMSSIATCIFNVLKGTANMNVTVDSDSNVATIDLPGDATGEIIVKVDYRQVYSGLANETKSVDLGNLTVGPHGISVKFFNDKNYNPEEAEMEFTIYKSNSTVSASSIEFVEGETGVIVANVSDGATGVVLVDVAGNKYYGDIDNGKASVLIVGLDAGNYTAEVTYSGDDRFNPSNSNVNVKVNPKHVSKSSSHMEFIEVNGNNVTGVLKDGDGNAIGNVEVRIMAKGTSVSVLTGIDGSFVFEAVNGVAVTVVFEGDSVTEATNSTITVEIPEPVVKSVSYVSFVEVNGNNVTGVLKDGDGNAIGNVEVRIMAKGTSVSVLTGIDGSFVFEAVNGVAVTIAYEGDNSTEPTNATITIKQQVDPVPVQTETRFNITGGSITINGYAVDTKAGEQGIAYATELLDANGKPVKGVKIQFAVNDKIYNRTTNSKGSFNPYNLNMIRAGRYTMAFSFGGNKDYASTFAVVCVDLDKKPINIKASKKSFKAKATKKYTVTLSTIAGSSADGKVHLRSGLQVTLMVNGKTYIGKTNSKGQVTYKITNLSKKAKYLAKISYEGDVTYESASKTVTLTVK